MNAAQPFVVAVCPIRNRAWIVDEHWDSVRRQTVPPRALYYLTGDNTDDTEARIRRLQRCVPAMPVSMRVADSGSPHWHRSREGERYTGDSHRHLSEVYNELIHDGLSYWPQATHLWLVDSDVLPEPGCLEQLLAADKDVIAPVVQHSESAFNFMVDLGPDGEPRRRGGVEAAAVAGRIFITAPPRSPAKVYRPPSEPGDPFPATFVSCCVLYRRRVLKAEESLSMTVGDEVVSYDKRPAFRFAPHPRSHDFPMMASLRAAGVELFVHPRARAEHRMKEPTT